MAELTPGQTLIGRYTVQALVGRGGMADVYRIWDQERQTELALKLLHDDLALDAVFLRRFQREAETLATLQHPNIVRFYGLERDDLQAFMLMDFIEGTNLQAEILRSMRTGVHPKRILEIFRPVCRALQYAHNKNFVHCDVKPANIMLHKNGTVLLADFGISRMTESSTTTTQTVIGTPAYMSPEQIRGEKPAPPVDIYALGIVLYEMLTGGERPFTGERATIVGNTSEKVRWEQLFLQPRPPRAINPGIPTSLEEVVMRCLAKDPTQRYPSAMNLWSALEIAVQGIPVQAAVSAQPSAQTIPVPPSQQVPVSKPPTPPPSVQRPATPPPSIPHQAAHPPSIQQPAAPVQPSRPLTPPPANRSASVPGVQATPPPVWQAPPAQPQAAQPKPSQPQAGRPFYPAPAVYTPAYRPKRNTGLLVGVAIVGLAAVVGLIILGMGAASSGQQSSQTANAKTADQATVQVMSARQTEFSANTVRTMAAAQTVGVLNMTQTAQVDASAALTARARNPDDPNLTLKDIEARAKLVYGPEFGELDHKPDGKVKVFKVDITALRDFIVEVTFYNPYATTKGSWDYGILFRSEGGDNNLRFVITSDRSWRLFNRVGANTTAITNGKLNNLYMDELDPNIIRLVCFGKRGWITINDTLITEVDLSSRMTAGSISMATALYEGDEIAGEITYYEDLYVWSLE